MEVRGHLSGVSLSFLLQTQAVSLGTKHFYLLSYLSSPCVFFLHEKEKLPASSLFIELAEGVEHMSQ